MTDILANISQYLEPYMDILELIAVMIVSFVIFSIISKLVKKHLLKKVKTKKQISILDEIVTAITYKSDLNNAAQN